MSIFQKANIVKMSKNCGQVSPDIYKMKNVGVKQVYLHGVRANSGGSSESHAATTSDYKELSQTLLHQTGKTLITSF